MIIDCIAFLLGYAIFAIGENVATLCIARAFMGYPLINTVISASNYKVNHQVDY